MRLSSKLTCGFCAAVFATFVSTPAAKADITFCNKFPQTVYVAIAYPQANGTWLSRGWLAVNTDQCSPFDSAIRVPVFYYRAEINWYNIGSGGRARNT